MFIKRLNELLKEHNISRKRFCEDVQINKNQVKRWEDNNVTPNKTTLTVIANYFGVSVAYLKGETEDPTPNNLFTPLSVSGAMPITNKKDLDENSLTEEEVFLIDLFRRVPEDKQELLMQMIRLALGKQE